MKKILLLLILSVTISAVFSQKVKITAMPTATDKGLGSWIPIVQDGVNKKILTDSLLRELLVGRFLYIDTVGTRQRLNVNRERLKDSIGGGGKQLWINVADYADSTGATDATAGIIAAHAALAATGGTLYFGAGHYKVVTGNITISKKVRLVGSGGIGNLFYAGVGQYNFHRGATTIFSTSATTTIFTITSEAPVIENIDFRLDSTVTPTTSTGVIITNGTGLRLTNCSFYNFATGFWITNGAQWVINECFFRANKIQALLVENRRLVEEGDQMITNCWFYGTDGGIIANQRGITYLSGGGLRISNTKFNNGLTDCIFIKNSGNASIAVVSISGNNTFEGWSGHGINVDSSIYSIPNIIIVGNEFYAHDTLPGVAIALTAPTATVTISANSFNVGTASTKYAVVLDSVVGYTTVGNTFNGYSHSISTGTSTVLSPFMDEGASNIAFRHNLFGDPTLPPGANLIGIGIAKGGVNYLLLGINKNSTTGSIPTNGLFISGLLSNGTLSLGRGNDAGLPSTNDIFISSTGAIGINNANPAASSILDVRSTTKGALLPSMTKAQRDLITSPGQGLLVFVTNGTGYLSWYNSGWQKVSSVADP